jgi:hypothetical protein
MRGNFVAVVSLMILSFLWYRCLKVPLVANRFIIRYWPQKVPIAGVVFIALVTNWFISWLWGTIFVLSSQPSLSWIVLIIPVILAMAVSVVLNVWGCFELTALFWLNRASLQQIEMLSACQFHPGLAQQIVDCRTASSNFEGFEELKRASAPVVIDETCLKWIKQGARHERDLLLLTRWQAFTAIIKQWRQSIGIAIRTAFRNGWHAMVSLIQQGAQEIGNGIHWISDRIRALRKPRSPKKGP